MTYADRSDIVTSAYIRDRRRIRRVRRAITDPGVNPEYHARQLARLRAEWPTLHAAIMLLIDHE